MNRGEKMFNSETVKILEQLAVLRTLYEGMNEKITQIHASNGKQWERIDENRNKITELKTKIKIFGSIIALLGPVIGGIIGGLTIYFNT